MTIATEIQKSISEALKHLFAHEQPYDQLSLQPTRREFEGTYTFVTFPYSKISKLSPAETGSKIGTYLLAHCGQVADYNVVKGFLNLSVADAAWIALLNEMYTQRDYGRLPPNGKSMMVEYSSPNTNKPLHLGHLRNNFLGYSISKLYEAMGYELSKVQIINDRGIHICKSMTAWLKFGEGETPESSGLKGDKLVGKYYVRFDREYKKEAAEGLAAGKSREEAGQQAPILLEAQEMLRKWEAKDAEIYTLWQQMNGWVYEGFAATYEQMGVNFDKLYYESDTYLSGKSVVHDGLEKGAFYQKEDGSVWVDLSDEGLDHKLLLRSDGTAVYITQDIGTAIERFKEFPKLEKMVYTVGNEQDYHFKVLFSILKKLGYAQAAECHHLSYGMVDLPSGKMKSREGTVVDADELMDEMVQKAAARTRALGKIDGFTETEAQRLYHTLGLGALKYFLLKVDPKKNMLFNPEESIEFQGNTAPFVQYTHARISAILHRAHSTGIDYKSDTIDKLGLEAVERSLIFMISVLPDRIAQAAAEYSPAVLAQYVYDLAKEYNKFFAELSIFNDEDDSKAAFRVKLSAQTARNIKMGMSLLGIGVPEKM